MYIRIVFFTKAYYFDLYTSSNIKLTIPTKVRSNYLYPMVKTLCLVLGLNFMGFQCLATNYSCVFPQVQHPIFSCCVDSSRTSPSCYSTFQLLSCLEVLSFLTVKEDFHTSSYFSYFPSNISGFSAFCF